jgi:peptidoglycan/xylan/chitin deacetylase (PgdA/CDA1 family)
MHDTFGQVQPSSARADRSGDRGRSTPARLSKLLRQTAIAGLAAADSCCSALSPGLLREGPGLIVIGLHSLCASRSQLDDPAVAPHQNVCVDDFRALVDAILKSGYTIVSAEQVDAGLDRRGRYVMLTFDDGYFNNVLALDVLDEFDVPATFFVSTNHVLEQKAFWWDAQHRALVRRGASAQVRRAALRQLKALPAMRIEDDFRHRFGPAALRPHSDRDRPFTRAELIDFSRHRHVRLGNHTADHAILTRCSVPEILRQIQGCQEALTGITGAAPIAIAYPNGNHSTVVVEAAKVLGLRLGFTVKPAKNRVPPPGAELMRLGRFYFRGDTDPRRQFQQCRCSFIPSRLVRAALQPS